MKPRFFPDSQGSVDVLSQTVPYQILGTVLESLPGHEPTISTEPPLPLPRDQAQSDPKEEESYIIREMAKKEGKTPFEPTVECVPCKKQNPIGTTSCFNCGFPLDPELACVDPLSYSKTISALKGLGQSSPGSQSGHFNFKRTRFVHLVMAEKVQEPSSEDLVPKHCTTASS